ncbi:MAG TPA: hypothetical protein VIS77_04755 [Burkholderiales bacterium]
MNLKPFLRSSAAAIAVLGFLTSPTVLADKPAHAGGGKHKPQAKAHQAGFDARQREAAHGYYGERVRAGHCPPGLAKKNNGCLPPGQAKKWKVGAPLPRGVIYHDVPQEIIVRIGLPPAGQRIVRVANDLLLIAVGTGMVLDAIEDLGKL